jgi:maltose O-acetyltransferase
METRTSQLVAELLFDYAALGTSELRHKCSGLPPKILRWLGAQHPDNSTRRIFFELTNVSIGEQTVINGGFVVSDNYRPLLRIGDRVAISPRVTVICASAPNNSRLAHVAVVRERMIQEDAVVIADDVWIGAGAIILPGVSLAEACVVGAGSVVTRDVPAFSVVAGNPAKIIRRWA